MRDILDFFEIEIKMWHKLVALSVVLVLFLLVLPAAWLSSHDSLRFMSSSSSGESDPLLLSFLGGYFVVAILFLLLWAVLEVGFFSFVWKLILGGTRFISSGIHCFTRGLRGSVAWIFSEMISPTVEFILAFYGVYPGPTSSLLDPRHISDSLFPTPIGEELHFRGRFIPWGFKGLLRGLPWVLVIFLRRPVLGLWGLLDVLDDPDLRDALCNSTYPGDSLDGTLG